MNRTLFLALALVAASAQTNSNPADSFDKLQDLINFSQSVGTSKLAESGPPADCKVNDDWTHSLYQDKCEDYTSGQSAIYQCQDDETITNCCVCVGGAAKNQQESIMAIVGVGSAGTSDLIQNGPPADCKVNNDWTHSIYKDKCEDYMANGSSVMYQCEDDETITNCCVCVGGKAKNQPDSSGGAFVDVNSIQSFFQELAGPAADCKVDDDFVSDFGETCKDFQEGGISYEYRCMEEAITNCCTCKDGGASAAGSPPASVPPPASAAVPPPASSALAAITDATAPTAAASAPTAAAATAPSAAAASAPTAAASALTAAAAAPVSAADAKKAAGGK
jgi:hypothetical protein